MIKDNEITQDLIGRLYNWKFDSAKQEAEKIATIDPLLSSDRELIDALADMFGNSGYFDGTMATIVSRAIETLIGKPDE